jgi:hypothetical protein
MRADREATRIVQTWLEDGSTAIPDRVLDAVLAELPSTPQRRFAWSPRRSTYVSTFLKLGAVAAVIMVAVVAGISFLPGRASVGGPAPASLPPGGFGGKVTFPFFDSTASLDVLGADEGGVVTGTVILGHREGNLTLELECASHSGSNWIFGGHVTASTTDEPALGTDAALLVVDGKPQRAGIWLAEVVDPPKACDTFVAGIPASVFQEAASSTGEGMSSVNGVLVLPPASGG